MRNFKNKQKNVRYENERLDEGIFKNSAEKLLQILKKYLTQYDVSKNWENNFF